VSQVTQKVTGYIRKAATFTKDLAKLSSTVVELKKQITNGKDGEAKEIMGKINTFIQKCQKTALQLQNKPDITKIQDTYSLLIKEAESIN
jgi:ElaB/YqjD/DUF883 family membrane-anchored ribosome-binding protein